MGTIQIASPVALGPSDTKPLAPRLASLAGRVLGIRVDRAWQSFHRFADETAQLARERLGVADVVVFDPEARIGAPEAESGKVLAFARRVDAAVVGLGT
jgi:broad specificity phosphatase PhoE